VVDKYRDAQLDALINDALAGSPTLAVAQARLQRADASVHGCWLGKQAASQRKRSVTEQKQS
jgi:outer membrane protein TolC